MNLFDSWMEMGWLWNERWRKWAGQHWCNRYLWWSAHHLVWLEAIHLSPVKSMSGNKMAQLLTAPKPSRTCSKEREWFCDCRRSFGLCFCLIETLWGWVKLQVWRVKPTSIDDFKTAVEDINAAILEKYICTTAATIKKRCKAFLLADGGNLEHFLTSM